MKAKTPLILALALTTLGAGVLAWQQYRELVELRAAAMNTSERAEMQKRLWDLERANRELGDRLAAGQGQGESLAGALAANPDDRSPGGERSKGRRGDSRGRDPNPTEQFNALRDLMANPEVQALLTSQQRAAIDARYTALFKSLNLSPDQAEKLKTLLAERQATRMDILEVARTQGIDPRTNPEAYRKLLNDARNETDASIKSVIGDSGFAQLQNYEQTMPQRALVNDLQQRLSYTNTPLNAGQADQLVQILANNAPQRTASNNANPADAPPAGARPPPPPGGGRGPGFDIGFSGPGGFDLGGLLALGGAAMGPGDSARGNVPITTAAVNQAQAVLSQPQLAVLQQLQQQQQAQQKIQQLVRETLASQAKTGAASTTATTPATGTNVPPPSRKRGGG